MRCFCVTVLAGCFARHTHTYPLFKYVTREPDQLAVHVGHDHIRPSMKREHLPLPRRRRKRHSPSGNHVTNGTTMSAPAAPARVGTPTSVLSNKMDASVGAVMLKRNTSMNERSDEPQPALKRPRHRRGLIWSPTDATFSPTARSTEYAPPVPEPPKTTLSCAKFEETYNPCHQVFSIV